MKIMPGDNITKKAIEKYMQENKRLDLRGKFDHRDIEVKFNISKNAEGSVSVKIGKTEVVCGIKMGVGEPYPDHEKEGTMMTTLELLPMSSLDYEYGPPRINAIETARIIDRGIRESGFIDFEKLCIKEGEKVWTIFIDLASINDDGNVLDAGALAAILALKTAKMPVYDEETGMIKYGEFTENSLPLTEDLPLTITFHKLGENVFIDPTKEEERASEGRLTIEMSQAKKDIMINAMQKGEESSLDNETIDKMLNEVEKIFKNLKNLVDAELKKAEK